MRILLLGLLAVTHTCFSLPLMTPATQNAGQNTLEEILSTGTIQHTTPLTSFPSIKEISDMLHTKAPTLSNPVINKVLTTLKCAQTYRIAHNTILTIIDYSLPSNEKRLWVFDLNERTLLFNTYVSHGIKSGSLLTSYFSNKNNSKASSMGVYTTESAYYGREGLSLKLDGLDKSFNDNAANRAVVMHGGWYVEERFIKKYGRAGRSWGCPTVPLELSKSIINTIKDKSLFVIYYPSDAWFVKSKFLNCDKMPVTPSTVIKEEHLIPPENSNEREGILFADINKNNRHEENEPVVVVNADRYQQLFSLQAPLTRMLRRPINNNEYIALSQQEFATMMARNQYDDMYFVIPEVKMERGYYVTMMKMVNLGKISAIRSNPGPVLTADYTVLFDKKSDINLRVTNSFIRWLGL